MIEMIGSDESSLNERLNNDWLLNSNENCSYNLTVEERNRGGNPELEQIGRVNQLINKMLIKLKEEMNNKERGCWWKDAKCLTLGCSNPDVMTPRSPLNPGFSFNQPPTGG